MCNYLVKLLVLSVHVCSFPLFCSLGDGGSGSGFEAGVVVAVVIILIIVVWVVVGVVFYKKNLFGFKDSVQQHITGMCVDLVQKLTHFEKKK